MYWTTLLVVEKDVAALAQGIGGEQRTLRSILQIFEKLTNKPQFSLRRPHLVHCRLGGKDRRTAALGMVFQDPATVFREGGTEYLPRVRRGLELASGDLEKGIELGDGVVFWSRNGGLTRRIEKVEDAIHCTFSSGRVTRRGRANKGP